MRCARYIEKWRRNNNAPNLVCAACTKDAVNHAYIISDGSVFLLLGNRKFVRPRRRYKIYIIVFTLLLSSAGDCKSSKTAQANLFDICFSRG